ncbi:MAG: hypothetical protein GX592_03315 [Clostridiales bacterium]|nr:hypothetical protein [Clostridiales bacterium]
MLTRERRSSSHASDILAAIYTPCLAQWNRFEERPFMFDDYFATVAVIPAWIRQFASIYRNHGANRARNYPISYTEGIYHMCAQKPPFFF